MALDKLVDGTQLDTSLTTVANAIRAKGGTSAQLAFPSGFVSAVEAIPTGSTPSGSTTVTDNGTYNIAQYASVVVAVPAASGVSF